MLTAVAAAAELSIPEATGRVGGSLHVPVIIGGVENLAGVKLVMEYDASVLRFQSAAKGAQAASMMHVVNDRQPGRLVIVMAGAKGIGGAKVELLTLEFAVTGRTEPVKKGRTELRISGVELMSDRLEEIECAPVRRQIRIVDGGSSSE